MMMISTAFMFKRSSGVSKWKRIERSRANDFTGAPALELLSDIVSTRPDTKGELRAVSSTLLGLLAPAAQWHALLA